VPRDARRIDARGTTLAAGFWNSHVHLIAEDVIGARTAPAERVERWLRETFTRRGFTTVFDVASRLDDALAVRARIESGEIPGPRILTVGDPFYPEGGTPVYVRDLYRRHGFASGEVATPEAARERAAAQIARGANGVKLFTGAIVGPPEGVRPMRTDVGAAAARPARDAGLPVFAHPTDLRGLSIAIDSGVTVLAHTTPEDGPWPDGVAQRVAKAGVALVPTLTLFEVELAKDGVPAPVRERLLKAAQQQVRALLAAGGDVLFGTDVGFIQEADTAIELRLLAAAGLDARAILKTLTTAPASRFDRERRTARVAPGFAADLVLLEGDPEQDVAAFAAVRCTIREGRVVYGAQDCSRAAR
jgi:imidazolonepropionase-like amidohydrolase